MKEAIVSKGQRGNKEAKKPKKALAPPAKPTAPGGSTPPETNAAPPRLKK
jgi:hypothetical protein